MAYIEATDVVKQFSNHLALDHLSLSVPKGSIYGLLGPNGAGKTTFIRIINQITAPDSGTIIIDGKKLNPKHIYRVGYLPEERGLYKKMKVGEQALYLSRLKGMSKHDALRALKFWFEKFDISEWWNKKVEELSKGMAQKVQFITTVLHKPELLIFDEPFSGFDPINANLLKKEIINLRNEGATILFSTHIMSSVEEICDDIALINKSKKILEGSIDTIKESFSTGLYEFVFSGYFHKLKATLTSNYEILEAVEHENQTRVKLRLLNSDISSNDLVKTMMQYGNIEHFNRIRPILNDIFIQAVEEASEPTTPNEILSYE
ncbi:MAG: ATP-binding cassette domain-containing protein [Bacteroidales bacterium]|nr:ATP-binding cassette domain-containing protein [Bacteroidales bacterium]